MDAPVVLIIFNRPETTQKVFDQVAQFKPKRLFVIGEGPREDHPEDLNRCTAARAVVEKVDWDCQLFKNYADVDVGAGVRISTGLRWVFDQMDRAIILEDDCVPHLGFFRFCEELLDRYEHDERVMHIGGSNFQFGVRRSPFSYFFSCHNICWGWATWRRAWQHFDIEAKVWPLLRESSWLFDILEDQRAADYWRDCFEDAYTQRGEIHWDYPWSLACWSQSGLSILPTTNLITNIGFGPDSTHFKSGSSPVAYLPTEEITFPLQHPPCMVRNYEADRAIIKRVVLPALGTPVTPYWRARRMISGMLPSPVRRRLAFIRDWSVAKFRTEL